MLEDRSDDKARYSAGERGGLFLRELAILISERLLFAVL